MTLAKYFVIDRAVIHAGPRATGRRPCHIFETLSQANEFVSEQAAMGVDANVFYIKAQIHPNECVAAGLVPFPGAFITKPFAADENWINPREIRSARGKNA